MLLQSVEQVDIIWDRYIPNSSRCLQQQQQQSQFIWNRNNPNNTVPEFRLRPGPTCVWEGESSPVILGRCIIWIYKRNDK